MLKEFKEFAIRGNVIDLAIGVVIGGAFNAIVGSMVGDVFMPIIGVLTGGLNFSGLGYKFIDSNIAYGKFIQAIFVFVITAFALFLLIKGVNKIKLKEKPPVAPELPQADVQLLTEIRDLLKKQTA
jgi:large conductance mechanosensitive channel